MGGGGARLPGRRVRLARPPQGEVRRGAGRSLHARSGGAGEASDQPRRPAGPDRPPSLPSRRRGRQPAPGSRRELAGGDRRGGRAVSRDDRRRRGAVGEPGGDRRVGAPAAPRGRAAAAPRAGRARLPRGRPHPDPPAPGRPVKRLDRSLGLRSVVAISVGAMAGGGLFVLPGPASALTGPSLWLAYLLAGVLVLPAALAKAELATAMPSSGGTYLFIERSLGPFAGAVSGIGAALSLLLKGCFALAGLGAYVLASAPGAHGSAARAETALALGILAGVTALNVLGVRRVGRLQKPLVAITVGTLAAAAVAALPGIRRDFLVPQTPSGFSGLAGAAAFVFASYAGVTKIAAVAEEVRDPGRTIPRGILLSLVGMGTLYAAVAFVLAGRIPLAELAHDAAPIATLGAAIGGVPLRWALSAVAVLALGSEANATLLAASRFPFAMARDGLLPGRLGTVDPRLLTPVASILACAGFMLFAILALDVVALAKLASGFQILVFCLENLSLIVFREAGAAWYRPTYRVPLYPLPPLAGILGGMALLVALGADALAGIALFTGVAAAWHLAYGRSRVSRRGLLQNLGRRTDLVEAPPGAAAEAPIPEARVVVALFGKERSPEALFEIGAALRPSPESRIDVLYLREIPGQTELAGGTGEDDRIAAVRRRVLAIAGRLGVDAAFVVVVTHDARRALYAQAAAAHCEWVIVGHRRRRYASFVGRPLLWILHHLPAAVGSFRDAGVRVYQRILVLARPGPHEGELLRVAVALARAHGGRLTFVDVLEPGAPAARREEVVRFHRRLVAECGAPADAEILTGADPVEAVVHATAGADLLILASEDEPPLRRLVRGSVSDRIVERALCSVVQLHPDRGSAARSSGAGDGR
ncbi:MAG: amino acid permease [Acidobacteria bacterium]|nr:MAG: amino acid permease [Acidobacteriota bacterium]